MESGNQNGTPRTRDTEIRPANPIRTTREMITSQPSRIMVAALTGCRRVSTQAPSRVEPVSSGRALGLLSVAIRRPQLSKRRLPKGARAYRVAPDRAGRRQ